MLSRAVIKAGYNSEFFRELFHNVIARTYLQLLSHSVFQTELGFCIIWSFFSESDNMPNVKTPNLESDYEKDKGDLNHNCISLHNQLWVLMSSLCTAFSATNWRSSNPCPPLGQVKKIPAKNFNFLELVRIQKMYFEGKVNKQQACNREGSSRVKSWPLLTFGDKGLGVATIFW